MVGIELQFLGNFEVRRDGQALPLPPSKKTRALLAYLCLQPRRFRRDYLCELLWEIPDDPRGSLRWSLSKLRRLLDDDKHARILADRDGVGVDIEGIAIDIRELRSLVAQERADISIKELEAAAERFQGNFLEGLELSNFHDFHSWCVVEREQALRDRAALLNELVSRLAELPERALPHARALVALSPYEERYRADLIRLLTAERQLGEAEEQFQLGLRMLKEAGIQASGELLAARRPPRIDAPPTRSALVPPSPLPTVVAAPRGAKLYGREAEVARIADTLASVVGNQGAAMLLVSGAPGIGKTRVLRMAEALARDNGAFLLQAAAFESDAMRPFALWIDALRAMDSGAYDPLFGDNDAANRDRLFARLNELVGRECAKHPVVLVFDDVQWCDESSATALHYVARMNRTRPFFGLLAARDSEVRDNAAVQQALRGLRRDGLLQELEIGPLPGEALKRLLEDQIPGADSTRLSLECGGNPLLAIELARAELAGSIAGSLDELIRERLASYGTTGKDVLHWASVLDPNIDVGTLVTVSGLDSSVVGAALESAEQYGMLHATARGFGFAHELIARAVYSDVSPLRRQVMHRRIAELLEKDTAQDLARAANLAYHASLSGDQGLAARATVSAGRLCLRFFANEEAQSLARKGLQLAEGLPEAERVCVEIDLHDILLAAAPVSDWDSAAGQYTALAERALDHGAPVHARLGYHMASYVRWAHGEWKAAQEQSLQAMRVARGEQGEAHVVGMAEAAKCLVMIERDIPRADAMLMEASAIAGRHGFSHHAIAAGLGMLRFHENRLEEAEELFREARTLCKSAGDRVNEFLANEYLVMLDLQRGNLAQARERCTELLKLGDKLREGSEEPFARAMAGLCDYAADDAGEALESALADLRIADAKHRLAYILSRAAMFDCERGRADRAKERATEALGYATLLERATEMLLANAVLAHDCDAAGDKSGAKRFAAEVARLGNAGAATWTREIAAKLANNNERATRRRHDDRSTR